MTFHDIGATKMKARWIPHDLSNRQLAACMHIAGKLLARYQTEANFLNKIVSIDEAWVKSYDPRDPSAFSEWVLPEQKRYQKIN